MLRSRTEIAAGRLSSMVRSTMPARYASSAEVERLARCFVGEE
jgi:hypothetical protein